jgi:RNA recognition motif-containing protein
LPWNSTAIDILNFLNGCNTLEGEKSVHLAISHRDGRPNGEAFVQLASPADVDKAFEYNKNVMGHRYIESKLTYLIIIINSQLIVILF